MYMTPMVSKTPLDVECRCAKNEHYVLHEFIQGLCTLSQQQQRVHMKEEILFTKAEAYGMKRSDLRHIVHLINLPSEDGSAYQELKSALSKCLESWSGKSSPRDVLQFLDQISDSSLSKTVL